MTSSPALYSLPTAVDSLAEIRIGLRSPNFVHRTDAVRNFAKLLPEKVVKENAFIEALATGVHSQAIVDEAVAYLTLALAPANAYVTRNVNQMTQIALYFNALGAVVEGSGQYASLSSCLKTSLAYSTKVQNQFATVIKLAQQFNETLAVAQSDGEGWRAKYEAKQRENVKLIGMLSEADDNAADLREEIQRTELRLAEQEERLSECRARLEETERMLNEERTHSGNSRAESFDVENEDSDPKYDEMIAELKGSEALMECVRRFKTLIEGGDVRDDQDE